MDHRDVADDRVAQLVRRLALMSIRSDASAVGLQEAIKDNLQDVNGLKQTIFEYLLPSEAVPEDIVSQLMLICEERNAELLKGATSDERRSILLNNCYIDLIDDCQYSEILSRELTKRVFEEFEKLIERQEEVSSEMKVQIDLVFEGMTECVHQLNCKMEAAVKSGSNGSVRFRPITLEMFGSIGAVNNRLVHLFGRERVSDYYKEVYGVPLPNPFLATGQEAVTVVSSEDDEDVFIIQESRISTSKRFMTITDFTTISHPSKGDIVLAKTASNMWVPAEVIHCLSQSPSFMSSTEISPLRKYKIIYKEDSDRKEHILSNQYLAMTSSEWEKRVIYPVSTRVVAFMKNESLKEFVNKVSGTIFEIPTDLNRNRYLIYFDTGCVQYVSPRSVMRSFYQPMTDFSELRDSIKSFEFFEGYLKRFPERAMVRLKVGEIVKVKKDGKLSQAKVVQLDHSMASLLFPDESKEWIFRGSMRFATVSQELQRGRNLFSSPMPRRPRAHTGSARTPGPMVEYVKDIPEQENVTPVNYASMTAERRSFARKSTSGNTPSTVSDRTEISKTSVMNGGIHPLRLDEVCDIDADLEKEPPTPFFYNVLEEVLKQIPPNIFTPHEACYPECLKFTLPNGSTFDSDDPQQWRGKYNPLLIPVLAGWRRHRNCRSGEQWSGANARNHVSYISPCGRSLRKASELHRYLMCTNSLLSMDFFCFDPEVEISMEYRISGDYLNIPDFTNGREDVPLQCVNTINQEKPPHLDYRRSRFTKGSVQLNEEPDFLVCCDCIDDCSKVANCACRKLTIEGTAQVHPSHRPNKNAAYKFRRLTGQLIGGLFECNSRCSCHQKQCVNRLVQNGIWAKMQMFKTDHKGWGVRALHDIPKGAFVCIYAGEIYDSATADKSGTEVGDEYQADLDFIEAVERPKEGYEETVNFPADHEGTSEEEDPGSPEGPGGLKLRSRNVCKSPQGSGGESGDESCRTALIRRKRKRLKIKIKPKNMKRTKAKANGQGKYSAPVETPSLTDYPHLEGAFPLRRGVRYYFGEEDPYVMDAKLAGNLGRYFNHACEPNMYVQNVLVHSHDPRIPEIAFFAQKNIKAGEEMTWDYQYEPNSVENRTLLCHCASENCRRRLL